MALQMADCYVDYSRNLVTDTTLELLTALAQRVGLTDRVAAMFSGAHLNATEHWAVLHTALRLPRTAALTAVRLRVLHLGGSLRGDVRTELATLLAGRTALSPADVDDLNLRLAAEDRTAVSWLRAAVPVWETKAEFWRDYSRTRSTRPPSRRTWSRWSTPPPTCSGSWSPVRAASR
ncbi:hypothetical protein [Micromonospora sp. U56]|uniref:hypothetical protein n=1 Tax=Micromonospora sp. U56 TaxID=2824900 RepID=UPI0027DC5510|nr:hypothetical protein [Micromonospora sp. U56]